MNRPISKRDREVLWHPYTPMKIYPEAIGIIKGEGAYLIDEQGNRYLDAISSWWVNLHGHAHPYIAGKIAQQMQVLEHCIFAGFTHEPAVLLAERLLPLLPGEMAKIFYSDNGSTAVEVAVKMAIQYWKNIGQNGRCKIIAIEHSYHGDTFGAMSVSARSVFTEAFNPFLFDVQFIPFPSDTRAQESLDTLKKLLKSGEVAAFIAEPLVLGSGGMLMYSAAVLEQLFSICKQHEVLIIADEVMTGFGRSGTLFACDQATTMPDIICLSKGITGGFLPMGVTATTQEIFDAFYNDDRSKMLYHGHSYTANATICAAALASLNLTLSEGCADARQMIAGMHNRFLQEIKKHEHVSSVRQTGTILAMDLKSDSQSYHASIRDKIYNFFLERKIILRPLGNIIYILPPYCITADELNRIYGAILELLEIL